MASVRLGRGRLGRCWYGSLIVVSVVAASGCDEGPASPDGASAVYGIALVRRAWFYSSPPLQSDSQPFQAQNRGQLLWFNPNTVPLEALDPTEEDLRRRDPVPALEVIYAPSAGALPGESWGALVASGADAIWDPLTPPSPANFVLDTEDRNLNGGHVEPFEDRGLDWLINAEEPPRPPGTVAFTPFTAEEDPAADDPVPDIDEIAPEATRGSTL